MEISIMDLHGGELVEVGGEAFEVVSRRRIDGNPVNDDQLALAHVFRIRIELLSLYTGEMRIATLPGTARFVMPSVEQVEAEYQYVRGNDVFFRVCETQEELVLARSLVRDIRCLEGRVGLRVHRGRAVGLVPQGH